jgi:hypothetical protein
MGISNHTTYVALNPCICQLATGVLKTRSGSRQPRAEIHHRPASCHGGYTLLSPSLHSHCVLSYSGISLPEAKLTCNALNLGVEFFLLFLFPFRSRYSLFSSCFTPSSQFQSSIANGVHIVCKQNLSGHECCIMPNHISLSDFVLNRVCCLVSFRILASRIDFRSVVVRATRFCPAVRPSPTRPSPAGPARPWRPCPPLWARPPSPFLSFDFSRTATSLSLSPVVPKVLEMVITGFGPRGELLSPSPYLSPPPPPLPFPLRAFLARVPCAPAAPRPRVSAHGGGSPRAPLRPGGRAPPPARPTRPSRPSPTAVPTRPSRPSLAARPAPLAPLPRTQRPCSPTTPRSRSSHALSPCAAPVSRVSGPAAPCPGVRVPRARPPRRVLRTPAPRVLAAVCPGGPVACPGMASHAPDARAACLRARNCSCAAFDFQLYPFFNFSLVDVLCRALRRATIQFKFIFVYDLCRALRRATFHFKSSSVDVCRCAFRRATLNVYL